MKKVKNKKEKFAKVTAKNSAVMSKTKTSLWSIIVSKMMISFRKKSIFMLKETP